MRKQLKLERLKKLNKLFSNFNINALFINNIKNIFYLSGFTGSSGYLFLTRKKYYFITDKRYKFQAEKEVGDLFEIVIQSPFIEKTIKKLTTRKIKRIGIEFRNVNLNLYQRFKKEFQNINFQDISDSILYLRSIKDDYEVKLIKKALRISEKAFNEVKKVIKPGVSENDIAIELEYKMRSYGAEGISFASIVASGKNSSKPHAGVTMRKIRPNDIVLIDFGSIYNSYCSDITRFLIIGELPARIKKIINVVNEAFDLAVQNLKVNISGSYIDTVVDDYIKKEGFKDGLIHSIGHGVGIEVHEFPLLSRIKDMKLKNGMVFTIEPGIYIKNLCGIRYENMIYIKNNKVQILNSIK